MRIALRSSGGRGEYELTGTQDNIGVAQVYDKQFVLEVTPGNKITTQVRLLHLDGKPRMRLLNENKRGDHIYKVLAAICLLPKPIREIGKTGYGKLQIVEGKYSVSDIDFDIVALTEDKITIRPNTMYLANGEDSQPLDIVERMHLVLSAWNTAKKESVTKYTVLLEQHYQAYVTGSIHDLIKIADQIRHITDSDEDPLRQILRTLGISNSETYAMGLSIASVEIPLDDNPLTINESKQEIIRKWRRVAYRGAAGKMFKKQVGEAYNNTCLFTGYFLPVTTMTNSPGVDAAHILPWAEHGLNHVVNGICLSKLCHWAFDQGILKLHFDRQTNDYILSIPEEFKRLHKQQMDLSPFEKLQGKIPKERLPSNERLWPDINLLDQFNALL